MPTSSADVVVVGGGGSGLACAIEAARAGASVIVLEKGDALGGTTGWSVGSYTTSSTPHQRKAGVIDSPAQHYADMDKVNAAATRSGHTDNLELRRLLTDHSPATFQWLMDLGIEFIGPNPEPPHSQPRMHNVIPSATAFVYFMERECRRLGVELRLGHEVLGLQMDGGRVAGVRVRRPDGSEAVCMGRRGVVLASGDFAAGKALLERYLPQEVVKADSVNPHVTGDGIRMGEALGATIINGGHANSPRMRFVPAAPTWFHRIPPWRIFTRTLHWIWDWVPPALLRPFIMQFITTALGPEPSIFRAGGLLVGRPGQIIPVDLGSLALHLARQPENLAYILFDDATAKKLDAWPNFISTAPGIAYAYLSDYARARPDLYRKADTLEALCTRIGVDAAALQQHLAALPVEPGAVRPLQQGPFHALGPARAYVTITEGGLSVDGRLRVIDAEKRPIPGLYAAGSTGQGGMLIEGHGHHVSWAFVSGRIAAWSVLEREFPASA